MTSESTIRLLKSKLWAYKNGYLRASAIGDETEAAKWRVAYISTRERIIKLNED